MKVMSSALKPLSSKVWCNVLVLTFESVDYSYDCLIKIFFKFSEEFSESLLLFRFSMRCLDLVKEPISMIPYSFLMISKVFLK